MAEFAQNVGMLDNKPDSPCPFDFQKYLKPIMTTLIKPNIEIPEDRQAELDRIFEEGHKNNGH